jgi:hypothetical protein
MTMPILPWEPLHTPVPLRTGSVLRFPIKDELRSRQSILCSRLPTPSLIKSPGMGTPFASAIISMTAWTMTGLFVDND